MLHSGSAHFGDGWHLPLSTVAQDCSPKRSGWPGPHFLSVSLSRCLKALAKGGREDLVDNDVGETSRENVDWTC